MSGKKITEMWAWVCTEADGGEGVPAVTTPFHGTMPMLGADEARVRSFEAHARTIAAELGLPVRLVRFTNMETIEVLQ